MSAGVAEVAFGSALPFTRTVGVPVTPSLLAWSVAFSVQSSYFWSSMARATAAPVAPACFA